MESGQKTALAHGEDGAMRVGGAEEIGGVEGGGVEVSAGEVMHARCLRRTTRSSGVGAELLVKNRNGVVVASRAWTNSSAPAMRWFSL
jgi:hypothetical protein